jgi:hypothetical protein
MESISRTTFPSKVAEVHIMSQMGAFTTNYTHFCMLAGMTEQFSSKPNYKHLQQDN